VGPNTAESQRLQQVYSLERQKVKHCLIWGLPSGVNGDLSFVTLRCDVGKSSAGHFDDNTVRLKVGTIDYTTRCNIPEELNRLSTRQNVTTIIIIIIIPHQLGLDRPVSTLSNCLFEDLSSRLRPFVL
jgi:hypothetical protein